MDNRRLVHASGYRSVLVVFGSNRSSVLVIFNIRFNIDRQIFIKSDGGGFFWKEASGRRVVVVVVERAIPRACGRRGGRLVKFQHCVRRP